MPYTVSDITLSQILTDHRAWLSSGVALLLRLYTNEIDPGPEITNPAAFVEANFSGYVPFNLFGTFGLPIRQAAGNWYISADRAVFRDNGGPVQNIIWGWFLTRGGDVIYSQKFDSSLTMEPGSEDIQIILRIRSQSRSILTCVG